MPTVVLTEELTKDFPVGFWRRRPRRALSGLSLEVPAGEVFGLLGPNGAGKSTTLKLLVNLIWPTSGRAQVLGHPPGDVAARQRLGFLPENPTFYDHLTAEELLAYFAGLFGYRGAERRRRVSRVLDRVGLREEDFRRPLRQLSKGMLQRVGLAQALVNEAELVILDEPMSGLDPIGRRDVRELILELRDEGRTVLFSSHVLSDAEWLCSRVAILSGGRLVACGTVAELTADAAASTRDSGWELVMAGLTPAVVDRLGTRVRRTTKIAEDRYTLELPAEMRPEALITDLSAAGARLVSVMPIRTTLEDVFLQHVWRRSQS
jgi:ABC-2 type transport system ATP-binding protein